jgi:hypothetical protein
MYQWRKKNKLHSSRARFLVPEILGDIWWETKLLWKFILLEVHGLIIIQGMNPRTVGFTLTIISWVLRTIEPEKTCFAST